MCSGGRGQIELPLPCNPLTIHCSLQECVSLHVEAPHRVSDCLGRKQKCAPPPPSFGLAAPWPGSQAALAAAPSSPFFPLAAPLRQLC